MSHDCTIFLSHYTNYLIVFVLSRDIFYLCSIYTAKITEFVQRIICKRTKEKAWHILQTFCIYYITIQILYLKIAFLSILFVLFLCFYIFLNPCYIWLCGYAGKSEHQKIFKSKFSMGTWHRIKRYNQKDLPFGRPFLMPFLLCRFWCYFFSSFTSSRR